MAKDEMCRKTFNVSERKLIQITQILTRIHNQVMQILLWHICNYMAIVFLEEVDTVLLELKYTPKIKVIFGCLVKIEVNQIFP
jgi:hypothetical protein